MEFYTPHFVAKMKEVGLEHGSTTQDDFSGGTEASSVSAASGPEQLTAKAKAWASAGASSRGR